ncbi:hypothetical protein CBER1_07843 [Cercospora berteroae]|uniref:Heterokaryon incompatibility domain-containing protein n=1 Tax=Cercospora berteroae TaxID=357750 RepID=A0A2S6C552_9PEZI|nr:hypothetical protein CBER1_07843 [Cercospora berteroae]
MADNPAKKTANSSNIYGQLDISRKEIRICHVEDALDQEGRVRCRLEIVSLEPAKCFDDRENGDLQLPLAMQRLVVQDDDTETGASGTADTALSKIAREVEGSDQVESGAAHPGKPLYKAISWTWGDPNETSQIVLNDKVFEVSRNAEALLRRLCFEQQHWTIWLDAICINQTDLVERGQQVAIMRDVYTSATQVLIWLGEDNETIAEAAFTSIDTLIAECMEHVAETGTPLDDIFFKGNIIKVSHEPLSDCDWHTLKAFFSHPWFTRLWVVQEVLLGTSPRMYCGTQSRVWSEVGLAAQWLHHRAYERYWFRGLERIERRDWPTWVPRYHWQQDINSGTPQHVGCRGHAADKIPWKPHPSHQDSMKVLKVQGMVVSRVTSRSEPLTTKLWRNDSLRYEWISRCGQVASEIGQNSRAIALTLTCEMTSNFGDAVNISDHTVHYEEFVTSCEGKVFKDLPPGPLDYVQAVYLASGNRVFFTMEDEGGMGMGPPGMRVDDLVCILFGARVACVLRAQGEHHVYVGAAYVLGLMQGQYVRYLREKGLLEEETRWFEIH